MWQIKTFKTKNEMRNWIDKNRGKFQIVEIFVNNAYGIEYRKLRMIG